MREYINRAAYENFIRTHQSSLVVPLLGMEEFWGQDLKLKGVNLSQSNMSVFQGLSTTSAVYF